ncbi:MAG: hypothetical protein LBT74_14085 [Acidobacteriota bacterium]|jgi:hypothetical protein|nr:hypothetical protein [Acidobacteriota bacterium]
MYENELDNLEALLRRLTVGYRVYLRGKRLQPPVELTAQVERLIQRLSESSGLGFAQRYRLSTLVTRYYTYRDLWRRLQQQQAAKTAGGGKAPGGAASPAASLAPDVRVVVFDPAEEEGKILELYGAFLRLAGIQENLEGGGGDGKPPFSLLSWPQFFRFVEDRVRRVREDAGGLGNVPVVFTLSLTEDAVRFTAEAGEAEAPS